MKLRDAVKQQRSEFAEGIMVGMSLLASWVALLA